MKRLLVIFALLAVALAACSKKPEINEGDVIAPAWACSKVPLEGERTVQVDEYCGRYCGYKKVDQKQYGIAIKCEFVQWRNQ